MLDPLSAVCVVVGFVLMLHGMVRSIKDLIYRHDAASLEATKDLVKDHSRELYDQAKDHHCTSMVAAKYQTLQLHDLEGQVQDVLDRLNPVPYHSPCGYHSRGGP